MARAPALQAGGRGFEPHILHRADTKVPARFFDRMEEKADTKKRQTSNHASGLRESAGHKRDKTYKEREASEGVRRMPWLPEAKKGAAGRESLRGGANGR